VGPCCTKRPAYPLLPGCFAPTPAGAGVGDDDGQDTPGSLAAITPLPSGRADGDLASPRPAVTLLADRSVAQIVDLVQAEDTTVWLKAMLSRLLYGGNDVGDPRMLEKKVCGRA
jgi:hypothetical protein